MYFTIPGVKKIVRYIEAFVTYRFVISRFHCNLSEKTKKIYIILLITFHHSTIEKMIAKTLDLCPLRCLGQRLKGINNT